MRGRRRRTREEEERGREEGDEDEEGVAGVDTGELVEQVPTLLTNVNASK